MYLDTVIEKLNRLREEHGNLRVFVPGDHQEEYLAEWISAVHIRVGECGGGYNVIHPDDLHYYEDEDPELVVSIS